MIKYMKEIKQGTRSAGVDYRKLQEGNTWTETWNYEKHRPRHKKFHKEMIPSAKGGPKGSLTLRW